MAKETGGIGAGPEEFIFIELVAIGPAVATGGREGLEGEILLSAFPQIGKEAIENLGHREKRRANIPAKAVGSSLGYFSTDRTVFFQKSDPAASLF